MFNRIFAGLAGQGGKPDQLMIDATYLKGTSDGGELLKKRACPRRIRLAKAV
ncbi:hypothetical protein [Sphingomonas tagetis]|uniref:hypothetical protein n=1 Tax=Sphingomonas tagetis TaxID=2949092 RepID=UPI0020B7F11D|nr:hypothetical protein [Sphingomonas tagetis]